jgi:ribosome-binding factor A
MRAIPKHRGPSIADVHRFCAALGEEDGEDPHLTKRRRTHGKRSASSPAPSGRLERKVCQLCRQVAVTLDEVLADCGDAVLRGLRVATVAPYPNASRLLVTVAPVEGRLAPDAGPKVVIEHLERASGHLRYEIAAAVTRKRAPLLHYRLAEPALEVTHS